MSLINELIQDKEEAIKNGDFIVYSKLCLILSALTVEESENTTE